MLILGIDPGSNTGMATFIDGELLHLRTVDPVGIEEAIRMANPQRVVFEDSRLQPHTWSASKAKTKAEAAKIGRNVGEIDAWCKLIVATCEKLDIPCHGISPKGKGAKIEKQDDFNRITGWAGKSNQHERDAAMCALPYRGAA